MSKQIWLVAAFSIILGIPVMSQAPHNLRCLSVNVLSDVTITWEIASGSSEFIAYNVFHAESSNPSSFQLLTTITDFGNTSYVHTTSSSGQMSNLYYIETEITGGNSLISDTVRTMYLNISDNGEGELTLSWNNMHDPPIPTSSALYNIFIEYPLGTWSLLASTSQNSYIHEVKTCGDSLSFQVSLQDDYGCASTSNIVGGTYDDLNKPPMPIIDSVSIDLSDREIVIGWPQSSSTDAIGYLIYRYINGNWIPIDTLWGRDNTFYKDYGVLPCEQSQAYALATLDSCGNKSLGSFGIPQRSIVLEDIDFNPCDATNTLNWSAYVNMEPALLGYQVLASKDGGPFQIVGSVPAGQLSYNHSPIDTDSHYDYFVRAFNAINHGSSSCIKHVYTIDYVKPGVNYLANVSVTDNQSIEITSYLDNTTAVQGIRIYRKDPVSNTFEEIEEISPINENLNNFIDNNVSVNQSSYRYQISLIDSCGNEILYSDSMPSIHLVGVLIDEGNISLSWNDFSGWDGTLEGYRVYRGVDGNIEPTPITTLAPGTTDFVDGITGSSTTISSFSYLVTAFEGSNNSYGFQEISYSNIIQVMGTPILYMPNAFRPGGVNKIFKPVGNFVDQNNYLFQIFDRWGRMVFETRNYSTGWDGTFKGKSMPHGVYVYIVNYQAGDGSISSLKGSFVLLQ